MTEPLLTKQLYNDSRINLVYENGAVWIKLGIESQGKTFGYPAIRWNIAKKKNRMFQFKTLGSIYEIEFKNTKSGYVIELNHYPTIISASRLKKRRKTEPCKRIKIMTKLEHILILEKIKKLKQEEKCKNLEKREKLRKEQLLS